jgi:hypothetical protein
MLPFLLVSCGRAKVQLWSELMVFPALSGTSFPGAPRLTPAARLPASMARLWRNGGSCRAAP